MMVTAYQRTERLSILIGRKSCKYVPGQKILPDWTRGWLFPYDVTMRRLISSGSTFESEIGYSRAVVEGDWVFVSGTTGFDYRTMTIADGVTEQTEQCLRNIQSALAEAGS